MISSPPVGNSAIEDRWSRTPGSSCRRTAGFLLFGFMPGIRKLEPSVSVAVTVWCGRFFFIVEMEQRQRTPGHRSSRCGGGAARHESIVVKRQPVIEYGR